ncbi:MAG: hypothetical protein AAF845_13315 [Bacteroidota bacterium]
MNDSPEAAPARDAAAMDRVQTPVPSGARSGRGWWRPLAFVGLIVAGIVLTWFAFRGEEEAGSDNLLVHLVEAADVFQPDLSTTEAARAEGYILEALGWAVSPPDLPALALVGVGVAPIGALPEGADDIEMPDVVTPAYRYEGQSGETAFVFAYDYIVLDQVRTAFDLPEATYAVLAEPTPVDARRLGDAYLVTWRQRAIIYTAVTRSEEVFERIGQAVAT